MSLFTPMYHCLGAFFNRNYYIGIINICFIITPWLLKVNSIVNIKQVLLLVCIFKYRAEIFDILFIIKKNYSFYFYPRGIKNNSILIKYLSL